VRDRRLGDSGVSGRAADRIVKGSGVARLFELEI
jgi:hypothetical protein